MERRKSFMLYTSQYETIKKLSIEQKAELMDAIFAYHNETEIVLSYVVDIVFTSFREQFKIDDIKYQKICERNAKNGEKGGRPPVKTPKKEQEKQKETSSLSKENPLGNLGTQENPKEPKKPDDDDDDDDDDIKKDTTIVVSKKPKEIKKNSFEEAEELFRVMEEKIEKNEIIDKDLIKFFEYWTAPMKSGTTYWRSMKTFAFRARLRNWLEKKNTKPDTSFTTNKPIRGTVG